MNGPDESPRSSNLRESQSYAEDLTKSLRDLGISRLDDDDGPPMAATSQLRRSRRKRTDDEVAVATLLDDDGVLRWRIGSGPSPSRRPGRRGRASRTVAEGRIVEQYKFADLPANKVGEKLRQLDRHLTGDTGLFEVTPQILGKLDAERAKGAQAAKVPLGKTATPPASGRALLLVHGTFSNGENLLSELAATEAGFALLKKAVEGSKYSKVFVFNHYTLSEGPLLSATALARTFRVAKSPIDVVCHSRGGLVTRWWLEMLDSRQLDQADRGNVVFLGSPLAGTGLAAPYRLKSALDVLTNVSKALGATAKVAGTVFPAGVAIGQAAGFLFGLFGKALSIASQTPLLDAGVAMIPGLAGQSREGSNGEILGLREAFATLTKNERRSVLDNYRFVTANFETEAAGWRFWRNFRKDKLADVAADMVFEGNNDLVVDSTSMTDLADGTALAEIPRRYVLDFGTTPDVHHCNYLRQEKTIDLLRDTFGL